MDIFKPIQLLSDLITYNIFDIQNGSYLGNAVNFFIYDLIKIGILLVIINYIMAITRYYFPVEKVKDILTKRKWYGLQYLMAALLGVITPFCSCSSIPLFIGFLGAGIPLGVTFAFLIASPLVNESSLIIFPAIFGMKITIIYNILGILIAIIGGYIISKLNLDKYVNQDLLKYKSRVDLEKENGNKKIEFKKLLIYWLKDGIKITKEVFPYIFLGVLLGALIHGFIPADLIKNILSSTGILSVPIATLIGVPIYANSISVIPVMEALIEKGVPLGTVLAFMTATTTLSVPQILMLKKAMRVKLLSIFYIITIIGIIIMGYLFNFIKF